MNNLSTSIATTREQSERLLSMGVKPETADMVHHHSNSKVKQLEWELRACAPTLRSNCCMNISKLSSPFHKRSDGTQMNGEEVFDSIWGKDVPAWSLSRLISMMPEKFIIGRKTGSLFISHTDIAYFGFDSDSKLCFLAGFAKGDDESVFDICIDMIDWLINNNHFNKEYLK